MAALAAFAMAAGATLAMTACAPSLHVETDYNHEADFGSLHTFAWLPPASPAGNPQVNTSILAGRVRRAVVADLTAKGYREVPSNASPDFYVGYQAAVDKKMSVRSTPTYYAYHGWWGPAPVGSVTTVHEYEVGTLIIDIVDRQRDDLIWRGSAQAKLRKSDSRTPEEREKAVAEAVRAILEGFPPTAGR